MATFVLVHGGGHGGWCWAPVAMRLEHIGHRVFAPTLTGLAERRHELHPGVGLGTHIDDVAELLADEDLASVILVGHSYGGMVVSGAADRERSRIARLVYLDAAIPRHGEALLDVSPALLAFEDMVRVVDGVRLGLWPDAVAAAIYGITDPDLAAWALPKLTPHPWLCFEQPLHLDDPWAFEGLPRAIVNCRSSLERRPEALRERWHEADIVIELDEAHDLMLTAPDVTVAALLRIAGEELA